MPDPIQIGPRMSEEAALDSIAVHILCGPDGCVEGKACPFDPMCAADLTPESKRNLIEAEVDRLTDELELAHEHIHAKCDECSQVSGLAIVTAGLAEARADRDWLATPKDAAFIRHMESYRAMHRLSIEEAMLELAAAARKAVGAPIKEGEVHADPA